MILDGARKHRVADEDMMHAYRNPVRVFAEEDDLMMFVGPARDGALLEIGVAVAADAGEFLIVHAMPARRKYLRRP